jgi:hypothetical protein
LGFPVFRFTLLAMEKEKRIPVSSKVLESVALTAFDKAFEERTTVSKEIEKFLIKYTKGYKKKVLQQ